MPNRVIVSRQQSNMPPLPGRHHTAPGDAPGRPRISPGSSPTGRVFVYPVQSSSSTSGSVSCPSGQYLDVAGNCTTGQTPPCASGEAVDGAGLCTADERNPYSTYMAGLGDVYRSPGAPLPRPVSNPWNIVGLGAAYVTTRGACPAWGCEGPARHIFYSSGATATVLQPPPSTGGNLVVYASGGTPGSPQPSPSVAVPTTQTAPSLTQPGTTLDSTGASTTVAPFDLMTWLGESTLFSSFTNWEVAGAGLLAAWLLFRGRGRR